MRPDSLLRLWRCINHSLTYLQTLRRFTLFLTHAVVQYTTQWMTTDRWKCGVVGCITTSQTLMTAAEDRAAFVINYYSRGSVVRGTSALGLIKKLAITVKNTAYGNASIRYHARHQLFTARCTIVHSAVLRSHVVRPSVRLWRWWIRTT